MHIGPALGDLRLDVVAKIETINQFKATMLAKKLSKKSLNNVLAVLSKALRYAHDVVLIRAPRKIGLYKVERPEIEF